MSGIAAITEREISLISQFVTLLKNEQECLKQGDASALPGIASTKTALVEQLNGLELERRALLGAAEETNTRQAMTHWLANHPKDRVTAINWKKLLELATEAKQLHEMNASLVGMHLQQTTEALAILTWHADKHTLYGSNGQTAQFSGSRIVDSA